jgi:probable HAF family extracellular repeat protein
MKDLGTFSGGSGTASAVNAAGYAVGNSETSGGPHAFIWHDNNGNNVSDPGELQDLGTLADDSISAAWDINDLNQVVGQSENDFLEARAFVWNQSAGMQPVPSPSPLAPISAFGINNAGHIVGAASLASGQVRAFLLNASLMIDLGTLGGTTSIAQKVAQIGPTDYVVGHSQISSPSIPPNHAFIWHDDNANSLSDPGEMKDLGTLGGTNSIAYDINASGQVVGSADVSPGVSHAFLWHDDNGNGANDPGEMKDLSSLIPPGSSWTLQEARSINDNGQIVGVGLNPSGQTHAFLLAPTGFSGNVTVAVSPSSVTEDGATNLVYTFTRTGSRTNPLTVNFSVSGTAGFTTDYTQSGAASFNSTSGTVTFGAGNSTATVTVDPAADSALELDETVILTMTSGTGYNIGSPSAATGTITNDDADVSVAVSPLSAIEDGATNLVYIFTRTGFTSGALTVNFSVSGTAGFTSDYTQSGAATFSSSAGTVTIGAGNSSASVTIDPSADAVLEGDETVALTVTSGTGYNIANPSGATGTITPDAPIVYVEMGTSNAVAVDSVTFVRSPFRLVDDQNFSGDQLTRVILITSNLGMTQQDLSQGILSVRVAGYANPLPIENVGTLTIAADPAFNVSYIVVRLPADLPNPLPGPNNLTLTVKMGSAESNATILSIAP